MLRTRQVASSRGGRELFSGIDLEVGSGDALRIGGRNGSGKTTLLRMLCGLTPPAEGEVLWKEAAIRRLGESFRREVIYVGHASGLKDDLLAWENLVVAARLSGLGISRKAALQALQQLDVAELCDTPVRALSQGQRKRVALSRLCLPGPKPLWILDEPAASLDDDAVKALCSVLDAHLAQGGMIVHATHQAMPLAARRNLQVDLGQGGAC
ncbi:cytochrome c biogenesis heme-transporting ATPase CcmA [Janthinobacterium sp. 17J80-10]|uniref:cytochrome c biogenesis heme-transporting ATPase CcmA n=1 Tax=Janthinobacterium sp. 17J80-10 TaxID=2497863 RepID=UPI0010056FAE|nr:cytochrome c biogenesis heme-transporting ATPase CcmA [Janthinobacterium sp. 17J80-10]QAU35482.1 cytochrome c biogenesis heme-transporting ATPase CcmA [Janthinobacterium sp. 17J80-10]